MSDSKTYDWNREKKIKKSEKGKRLDDKYRKLVYNVTTLDEDSDDAFDDYLYHEYVKNKTKIR
tara:strand:+ start:544 stop:732 length:189 start_codon:yes stop_codon:yes gene_type:complete